MSRSILITGALGHIGSKLIHKIVTGEFNEVIMLDNLSTQRYPSLFNLPKGVNFKFIEKDILETDLSMLIKDVNTVIHLAAITDAQSSFEQRDKVEQVNYEGTKRVAEACVETGVSLLFPSTTSVYGSQSEVVDETCTAKELNPQSPYAEYKLKSEQMLQKMGEKQGLTFVTCRFGTIFGTSIGMRFHTAINKFCWQAVNGQPLTVWETAMDQKRPYLGVNDAVRSIKFIIKEDLFDGEIYNIVSSNNIVRDIVDLIRITIPSVEIELVKSKIMNQLSYIVTNNKICKRGFNCLDSIEDGIKETLRILLLNN